MWLILFSSYSRLPNCIFTLHTDNLITCPASPARNILNNHIAKHSELNVTQVKVCFSCKLRLLSSSPARRKLTQQREGYLRDVKSSREVFLEGETDG